MGNRRTSVGFSILPDGLQSFPRMMPVLVHDVCIALNISHQLMHADTPCIIHKFLQSYIMSEEIEIFFFTHSWLVKILVCAKYFPGNGKRSQNSPPPNWRVEEKKA